MLDWLIDLPLLGGLLLFIGIVILVGVLIFIAVHYLFVKPIYEKPHYQVSKVLFRTSASLLALMLSFTYANQRIDYFTIKSSIQAEASTLVDIHMNLRSYGTQEAEQIQGMVQRYVTTALEEGWKPIMDAPFESKTFMDFRSVHDAILNLTIDDERQATLKADLLKDVDELSDYMQVRFYKTRPETPFLFYVACFGFVVVMVLFSTNKPDKISILFISLYNAFIGVVLYFIVMMNNPLVGPLQVKAESFEILKEAIDKHVKE